MNAHARRNTPTHAPLDHLIRDDIANARVDKGEDDIEGMMASIMAHGVASSLLVRPAKDGSDAFAVFAGSRRLSALQKLLARGDVPANFPVPITVCELTDEEAYELSLAENIIREAMHPVDQFEAFSRLADAGLTEAAIAGRFGIAERVVRQRRALGNLHPDIRAAWRAAKIPADTAQAFTLARDPMHQAQVYQQLLNRGWFDGDSVRRALGANHDAGAALKFVGVEAYRAAGGDVGEDLFGSTSALSDPALAKRLAAEALKKECERLVAEDGWNWALPRADIKNSYAWPKSKPSGKIEPTDDQRAQKKRLKELAVLMADDEREPLFEDDLDARQRAMLDAAWAELNPPIEHDDLCDGDAVEAAIRDVDEAATAGAWSDRQKKKAGCFLDITPSGALQITYGVQKPVDPKEASKAKAKGKKGASESDSNDDDAGGAEAPASPEPAPEAAISATLCLALSQQRTIAAAKALVKDPELALCIAVAALDSIGSPSVRLTASGYYPAAQAARGDVRDDHFRKFDLRLALLMALDTHERLERLAICVAGALDLQLHNPAGQRGDADQLVAQLDEEDFTREALELFDAPAYFKGVNAELCNKAADEMGLPARPRPKKKGELAELCAKEAKDRQWLPPELRHPSATSPPSLAAAMADALEKDGAE